MLTILISKEEGSSIKDTDLDNKELCYKIYRMMDCVRDNLGSIDWDSKDDKSVLLEITDETDSIRINNVPYTDLSKTPRFTKKLESDERFF